MKYKKFLWTFFTCTFILAIIYSTFIFIKDPLGYYDLEEESSYYYHNGRYQLPSFVRNLDYDTIIIGPSMSQNFNEQVLNKELDVQSLNAALSASSAKEQNYLYTLANESNENLTNVFWEINFDSLHGSEDRVNEESGAFPKHLYTKTTLDDFKYLFSYLAGEVYIEKVKAERRGDPTRSVYEVYKFGKGVPPLNPNDYRGTEVTDNDNDVPDGVGLQEMKQNFDVNIYPVLKENTDQNFKLYYAPYPILYQIFNYNRSKQAFMDRLLMKEYVYSRVKDLEHVQVYDFQTETEITFNLRNYVDGSHYDHAVNDWMTYELNNNKYLQSENSTEENAKILLKQVEGFSGEQLGEGKISEK